MRFLPDESDSRGLGGGVVMSATTDNRRERARRLISLDGLTLASLNCMAALARADARRMDSIALCSSGCGQPWTNDLIRHQRALLKGATPDVLVCDECFGAVKLGNG